MHKIDGDGNVAGQFAAENLTTGQQPTVVTADWLNAVQNEVINMLTAAGIAPVKADNTQLLQAVRALIESRVGDYVYDTGTANAVKVTLNPPVTAYDAKTAFTFKAAATNTGAMTVDAGGGAKALVREDGTAMQAGDVGSGTVVSVVYDTATGVFRSTEMVLSQVMAQITAHVSQVDPHSQYLKREAPWKDAVRVATTVALAATYANGTAGVGATLTATAVGAVVIDGVALAVGDRVLVKNQASASQNGLYGVTNAGSASATWMLTRLTYSDHSLELAGAVTTVDQGATNGGRTFKTTFKATDTIGSSACEWAEMAMVGKHTHVAADITDLVSAIYDYSIPVGTVIESSNPNIPPGRFLRANGAAVNRFSYSNLYAVTGVTHGAGDGSTTFNVVDRRNRAALGAGDLYALGATGGSKDAVVVSHSHTASVSDPGHKHQFYQDQLTNSGGGLGMGGGGAGLSWQDTTGSGTGISVGIGTTGSPGTDANLPPFVAMYHYVKY